MADEPSTHTWDDVRRVADELKLKLHLAGMDARDEWERLQPKLTELEKAFVAGTSKVEAAVSEQASALGSALKKLLADIKPPADKQG
jgi:hypothetical protein